MTDFSLSLINPDYQSAMDALQARMNEAKEKGNMEHFEVFRASMYRATAEEVQRLKMVKQARIMASLRRNLIGQNAHAQAAAKGMGVYTCGPSATFDLATHMVIAARNGIEAAKVYREMKPSHRGPVMVKGS